MLKICVELLQCTKDGVHNTKENPIFYDENTLIKQIKNMYVGTYFVFKLSSQCKIQSSILICDSRFD